MPTGRLTTHLIEASAFADAPVVVVDAGCSGGFDRSFAQYGHQAFYIGFDPNVPSGVCPGGMVYPWAVGRAPGKRVLYAALHPHSTGLLEPDPTWARRFPWQTSMVVIGTREIDVDTIDRALTEIGRKADFCKMDIEGLELETLQGSPGLVESCLGMSLETVYFPVRRGQPTHADVDRFMQDHGYMMAVTSPHRHARSTLSYSPFPENRGQMVWAQSLWIRDAWAEMEADRAGEWPRLRILKMLSLLDISGLPDMALEVALGAGKWGVLTPQEVTETCDLLTPTLDGIQFSYAEYWRLMVETERVSAGQGASGISRAYRANWGGRLG